MPQQKPKTLREQMEHRNQLVHRLAVWEMVHDHIDGTFIGKDGRPPKGLKAPGAIPELVPEEVFEEILRWLCDNPIAQLQAEIAIIDNQEVTIVEKKQPEAKTE